MLNTDKLSPDARALLWGERRVLKHSARAPTGGLARQMLQSTFLSSELKFTAPVMISSITITGPHLSEGVQVGLTYDDGDSAVLLARSLCGGCPFARDPLVFLSPVGMPPHDTFELYVTCGGRTELELHRWDIAFYAFETGGGATLEDDSAALVSFEVDGQSLHANKFMLAAASHKFRAQLFGEYREATDGIIRISDASFEAFKLFMALLADTSPGHAWKVLHSAPAEADLVEVFALADRYCATVAKSIAEAAVLQQVRRETAADLLQRCLRHKATSLAHRIADKAVCRLEKDAIAELLKAFVDQVMDPPHGDLSVHQHFDAATPA